MSMWIYASKITERQNDSLQKMSRLSMLVLWWVLESIRWLLWSCRKM